MSIPMPEYQADSDVLVNVDRAHKAVDKINDEIDAAIATAIQDINAKFTPVSFAATSVLYEAMGRAAEAGFTREQMAQVMECDCH